MEKEADASAMESDVKKVKRPQLAPPSFFVCFSSFWLDPKGPKDQDVAKLQPHRAERWPAATSGHRALYTWFCRQKPVRGQGSKENFVGIGNPKRAVGTPDR
jgi:hypothetical protein